MRPKGLYGVAGEFETPERLLSAVRSARAAGYRSLDAYSPMPIHGLGTALGVKTQHVSLWVLLGGMAGGLGGFFMQWWSAVIDYPIDVGGRPLFSWPAFIPLSFEMTILIGGISALLAFFVLNGLPMPYHPLFNIEQFGRASNDRFFLAIDSTDAEFSPTGTRDFLKRCGASGIYDVPH